VLDGCSRAILAWDIRPQMQEADAEIVLQRAREAHPQARPRIITDNGPQFVARDFKDFIRLWQTTHVFGLTPLVRHFITEVLLVRLWFGFCSARCGTEGARRATGVLQRARAGHTRSASGSQESYADADRYTRYAIAQG
jgi:hypothetical protein